MQSNEDLTLLRSVSLSLSQEMPHTAPQSSIRNVLILPLVSPASIPPSFSLSPYKVQVKFACLFCCIQFHSCTANGSPCFTILLCASPLFHYCTFCYTCTDCTLVYHKIVLSISFIKLCYALGFEGVETFAIECIKSFFYPF